MLRLHNFLLRLERCEVFVALVSEAVKSRKGSMGLRNGIQVSSQQKICSFGFSDSLSCSRLMVSKCDQFMKPDGRRTKMRCNSA